MTPEQRSQRSRIAAHSMHAKNDSRAITKKATEAQRERFGRQARAEALERGEPELSDAEVDRRASHLWRAHMTRLAFKSARARSKRAEERRKERVWGA